MNLFITGCSGFVGKELIKKLDVDLFDKVYCLIHKELVNKDSSKFILIQGDLLKPETYSEYLKNADIVIHMAALTGKAKKDNHEKINFEATKLLVNELMKSKRLKKLFYISTIAVTFKDKRGYYYALSKEKAENIIMESKLNYTILRPTMIFGKYSPVLDGFFKLINLPFVLMFGKGHNLIQPIYVNDFINVIFNLLKDINSEIIKNKVVEVGGKERIRIKDMIKLILKIKRENKKILVLPLKIFIVFLRIVEPFLFKILPFTTAQLQTFNNDGVAVKNIELIEHLKKDFVNLEFMLKEKIEKDRYVENKKRKIYELNLIIKYLVKEEANEYLRKKYFDMLNKIKFSYKNKFDKFLYNFAMKNRFFLGLSDTFSSLFYRDSTLRKKVLYVISLLEVSRSYYKSFEYVSSLNKIHFFLLSFWKSFVFGVKLFVGIIFFIPIKFILNLKSENK